MICPRSGLLLAVCGGLLFACSETPLEPIVEEEIKENFDNKLKLSGKFCTSDPADMSFPLKVLFIIDTSQSMNVNDPIQLAEPDPLGKTGRSASIRDVISRFIDITLPEDQLPLPCNTGIDGCEKGSTSCPACGAPDSAICIGPDCCRAEPCRGTPACPLAGEFNGSCVALCDSSKPGCGPGERHVPGDPNSPPPCPDCPMGDMCQSGVCGKHLDPGVEFAIMRFGSAKQILTRNREGVEGFTNDIRELVTALPQVNNGGSVTDYEGSLAMAFDLLSRDMADMQKNNTAAVSRSKYVVIFLTDGQPDPRVTNGNDWDQLPSDLVQDLLGPNGDPSAITQYNVDSRILRRVKELLGLRIIYRVGEIRFHTAFITGEQTQAHVTDAAIHLLKQMAQVGDGTFRNFQNGDEINYLHVDFSTLKRVFRLKNLIVTNINARPTGGKLLVDSDGDGISDEEEIAAGTDIAAVDSDGDGFSDTVEHFFRASGWDALDPVDADCSLVTNDADGDGLLDDSDGDGLLDCEERFLGTSKDLFDTDADGIPDGIEIKFGTNPADYDIKQDLDFDGMSNGEEIRLHTDPRSDDAAHRSRISYRYMVQEVGTGIEVVGLRCNAAEDCPAGESCKEGFCRCFGDEHCHSNTACTTDPECTRPGEICRNGQCQGSWSCQPPLPELKEADAICAAAKHITCYEFETENIALVTPRIPGREVERGWNQINLYFGEVPFDNPLDYGNFTMACVRARYNSDNGNKLPSSGKIQVPINAWNDPRAFSQTYPATLTDDGGGTRAACGEGLYCEVSDACANPEASRCQVASCVCPDGTMGSCID